MLTTKPPGLPADALPYSGGSHRTSVDEQASLTVHVLPRRLDEAIDDWRAVVGDAHVLVDPDVLAVAATTTFDIRRAIPAIVRPRDTAEVAACLRIAQRQHVPVYPISRGCNWGLGSRLPSADGCVLIDLSRMDRILAHDETLAYVTVQPGVTFGQLHAWLEGRGSTLYASVIGGSPDASVLANALERGDGDGPYGDRAAHLAGLQVVLPDGEVLETGFARFDGAPAAPLHPRGVGPALEQMFCQSNLGVVTRASIPLARRPAHTLAWAADIHGYDGLAPVIETLRALCHDGLIGSNDWALWNGWKRLALEAQRRTIDAATRTMASGRWHCSGRIAASDPEVLAAVQRCIVRRLGPAVANMAWSAPDVIRPGVPSSRNLHTMYWAMPFPAPLHPVPERDGCGLLWLCPAIPFTGEDVVRAMRLVEAVATACGFEAQVGLSASSARLITAYVSLAWDRAVPGADARGRACHDGMLDELVAAGYLPYRLGLASMDRLPQSVGAYDALLARIRKLIDPAGILAPGRYVPGNVEAG